MDDMTDKTKGMYLFYQFFMFISGLSLFLAILCVAALIYNVVQIAKAPAGEEGAQLIREGAEGGQKEKDLPMLPTSSEPQVNAAFQ
jgi:hypothetical protein